MYCLKFFFRLSGNGTQCIVNAIRSYAVYIPCLPLFRLLTVGNLGGRSPYWERAVHLALHTCGSAAFISFPVDVRGGIRNLTVISS